MTLATTASASVAINSLVMAGAADLTINDSFTLTDTSGAILFGATSAIKPQASPVTPGILAFGAVEAMVTVNPTVTGTIGVPISGSGRLTKSGTGALTLSGNNSSFTGGVNLNVGTLNVNHANALGTVAGTLTLAAGTTLDNTSGSAKANSANNPVAWNGDITFGTAASTILNSLDLGSGTVSIGGSRTVTFAGTGTTLTFLGTVRNTTTTGRTITANGAGNTWSWGD